MPFPTKLLNQDEEVELDLHPHWWFLSGPVTTVVVVLVGTIAAKIGGVSDSIVLVLVFFLLVSLFWLLTRYAKWATTNFVLTNDRIIHRTGVIAKHGREIPLDHINDISYNQSIFERIIGAGDLTIESAGERGQEVFPDLPKPGVVPNEIHRL